MSDAKQMEVLSDERRTFPPSKEFSAKAHIKSMAEYETLYKRSVEDPEGFWGEMADPEPHLVQKMGQGAGL